MEKNKRIDVILMLQRRVDAPNEITTDKITTAFSTSHLDFMRGKAIADGSIKLESALDVELCAVYLALKDELYAPPEVFFDELMIKEAADFSEYDLIEEFLKTWSKNNNMFSPAKVMNLLCGAAEQIGKSILTLSTQEIKELLGELDFLTYDSTRSAVGLIAGFVQWCTDNGYFQGYHAITDINVRNISLEEAIKRTVLKEPRELVDLMKKYQQYENSPTMPIYICFIWLGIAYADISELKQEDIDFEHKQILKYGVTFIPDPIIEALQEYMVSINELQHPYEARGEMFVKLVADVTNHRYTKQEISAIYFGRAFGEFMDFIKQLNINKKLTFKSIKVSGQLYHLRTISEGKYPSKDELIKSFSLDKQSKGKYTKILDYQKLYRDYLNAFDFDK